LYQAAKLGIIIVVRTSPEGGAPMNDAKCTNITVDGGAFLAPAGGPLTDAA
jgi:hypothetical protein